MKRIAIRIVSLVTLGLAVTGVLSACASEQGVFDTTQDGGTCSKQFCPSAGTGAGCCLTNQGPCGYDYGMGCLPAHKDGG